MIPPPLIEGAVWGHLSQYRSIELILLKGHLLLEVILDQALDYRDNISNGRRREISFSKKLSMLEKKTTKPSQTFLSAIGHTKSLNRLRNRLAHEPFFENGVVDLDAWAQAALQDIPTTKFANHAPRTRTAQAIASLGRALLEHSNAP